MHGFNKFSQIWLVVATLFMGTFSYGQTYLPVFTDDGGYPGTVNTLSYSSTTGFTEIIPGSINTNQWSAPVAIPFAFNFHGNNVSSLRASANGLVTFLSNPGTTPPDPASANPTIADANMPDSTIAAFWTSFVGVTTQSSDKVYYQTFGTAPNRQLWIKYYSFAWGAGNTSADFLYMSVVLEETTNNIYVVGQWADADVMALPTVVGVKVDASNTYEVSNPTFPGFGSSSTSDDDLFTFIYSSTACGAPKFPNVEAKGTGALISTSIFNSTVNAELEYGLAGFTQGSGTLVSNTTGQFNLNNLTPNTDYEFYLRSDCGSGSTSNWEGPYSFQTSCLINAFPYYQDFDNTTYWTGTTVDSCWNQSSSDDADWRVNSGSTSSSQTGPATDISGNGQYIYLEYSGVSSGDRAILDLPTVDNSSLTDPYLSFFYHKYGANMGDIYVETSLDNGATWSQAGFILGQTHFADTAEWSRFDAQLPSTSNLQVRIIGEFGSGYRSDMAIDSLTIGEAPSCITPGTAYFSEVLSSTELTVNWSNASASTRIEWGVKGFDQSTGTSNTVLLSGTDTYTITGLFRDMEYDVYVYGDCSLSGNGYTPIGSPIEARTLPAPYYLENFDGGFVPDDRWSEAAGVLTDTVNFISTFANWATDDWINVSGSPDNAARISISTSTSTASQDDWFFTPFLDLGAGGSYEIVFDAAVTGNNNGNPSTMQSDDTLFVVVNNDTNAVWSRSQTEYTIHEGNQPSNTGNLYRVDLSAYTGLVKVGFHLESSVQNTVAYNFFIDNFQLRTIPACAAPIGINIADITDSSVAVTWTPESIATQYVVYAALRDSSILNTTTIVDTVSTDSAYISGLNPNTEYDFYVSSICGAASSGYNGPIPFITNCIPVWTAPFSEDFSSLDEGSADNGRFANCFSSTTGTFNWQVDEATGSNTHSSNTGPILDNTTGAAGGKFIYTESTSGTTGSVATLTLPMFDLSALTTPSLSFAYHMYGSQIGTLSVDISEDGTNWQTAIWQVKGQQQTAESDPWLMANIDLSAYNSDTLAIRFNGTRGSGGLGDIAIDDITIDELTGCPSPSGFVASNVTSTTADFNWTSSNDSITLAISSTDNPLDSANTIYLSSLTSGSVSVSNLTINTCYSVYTIGYCGGVATNWTLAVELCTPCESFYNIPHDIDFENVGVNIWEGTLNNCWEFVQGTSNPRWNTEDANGGNENSLYTGPFYDNTSFGTAGGHYIFMEATSAGLGDTAILQSPRFYTGSATGVPAISFHYHMYGVNMGNLYVNVRNSGGPWTTVDSVIGQQQTAGSDAWIRKITLLQGFSDTIQVRFIAQAGSGYESDMALDDISILDAPNCLSPTNMTITNVTENSADLGWATTGTSVNIAVTTGSDPLDSATTSYTMGVTGTSTALTLDPATCYNVYVQSNCTSDSSFWTSAGSVCTPCPSVYNAPYSTDFESVSVGVNTAITLENCWSFDQGSSNPRWETEDSEGINENSGSTGPFYDNTQFGTDGGKYIFVEASGGFGDTAYAVSPLFYTGNLTNRPAVEFYYHMYGAAMGNLYVQVRNTNGPWTSIDSIVGQQQTDGSDAWMQHTSVIDGFADTIQVRFMAVTGTAFTSDMALDDISIVDGPSCPDPSALQASNIANTSVDLSWGSYNPGATVLVEYGAPGFDLGTGMTATVSANPGTLSGLTQGTCYDVYLREVCSAGDTTSWVGPVSFCTSFTCTTTPGALMPADTFVCAPSALTLMGGSSNMYWEASNGDIYQTGETFTTDTLSGDTSFFARGYNAMYSTTFGPSTDIATSGFGNFNNGEMITVVNEVRIDTVTLKSDGARSGTIRFYRPLPSFNNEYDDGDIDTMLVLTQEVPYSLSGAGEFRVPVGVALNPGQYFVNLSFDTTGTGELFRATSGADYPYTLDNIMSIDSAVGVSNFPSTRVYYFFDWTISPLCVSTLDTVNVEYAPSLVAGMTYNLGSATATELDVVFDASTSENASSYIWNFGDGNTGTGMNPTHSYLNNGQYTVTLDVVGVCGDTATVTETITVAGITVPENTFAGSVTAFPNPATDVLTLHIETPTSGNASFKLTALTGQVLVEETLGNGNEWTEQISVSHLPSAVYILTVQTADGVHIERITRQ